MKRLALVIALAAGCTSIEPRERYETQGRPYAPRGADEWPLEGTGPASSLRSVPDYEPQPAPPQPERRLRGGELDDNDRFDEYLHYRDHVAGRVRGSVHPLEVSDRVTLRVLDAAGRPASGARIILRDLAGAPLARRTATADGRALFFPRAEQSPQQDEWVIEATLGDCQARKVVTSGQETVTLRLDGERPRARPALDVVFCLDCTGSMGDEIDRLKATIDSVARRLAQLQGSPRVRLGLVKYRDRGDDYVVQKDDLTPELATFREALSGAYASGGGDYPEDVQAGLAAAVDEIGWDRSPTAARIVFLVGDAPPHLYQDEQAYTTTIRHAQEKGVKVCTLAASGLDDAGEYVWRQLAEATLGRFIFISYGTPGGGRGTPHHTGPYLENDLDEIVVRQCAREVDALTRGATPLDRDQ